VTAEIRGKPDRTKGVVGLERRDNPVERRNLEFVI
jgi:hypothetical protein